MNFDTLCAEAFCDHNITFWERLDRSNRVSGYTVERRRDGLKASMLHDEGRIWKGVLGTDRIQGTKAKVANWIIDQLANHD